MEFVQGVVCTQSLQLVTPVPIYKFVTICSLFVLFYFFSLIKINNKEKNTKIPNVQEVRRKERKKEERRNR